MLRLHASRFFLFCVVENEGVYNPDLYEGDMILTPDQRMAAEMGLDVDNPLGRGLSENRKWPDGKLVYSIDPSLGTSEFLFLYRNILLSILKLIYHVFLKEMCWVISFSII